MVGQRGLWIGLLPFLLTARAARGADSASDARAALEALLCESHPSDCKLDKAVASVTTASGGRNEVWRITYPDEQQDDDSCTFEGFWLVARDGSHRIMDKREFATGCTPKTAKNAWCGMPPRVTLRIRGHVVEADWEYHMRCFSVYHSRGTMRVSLDTFAPLFETMRYYRLASPHEETQREWNYERAQGARTFTAWGSDGCPPIRRGPVPRVFAATIAPAFLEDGWQNLDMSACSTRFDVRNGFALRGAKANVTLRLLLSTDKALFVDVEAAPSKTALLRVCTADSVGESYAYCQSPSVPRCSDIALDGTLRAGDFTVQRAKDRPRFKIQLPDDTKGLSVVYFDDATGRSLASSRLVQSDYTTLNDFISLDEERATCQVEGNELRLRYAPIDSKK